MKTKFADIFTERKINFFNLKSKKIYFIKNFQVIKIEYC